MGGRLRGHDERRGTATSKVPHARATAALALDSLPPLTLTLSPIEGDEERKKSSSFVVVLGFAVAGKFRLAGLVAVDGTGQAELGSLGAELVGKDAAFDRLDHAGG